MPYMKCNFLNNFFGYYWPVSTTTEKNVLAGVFDTSNKLFTGVNNTGDKLFAGVNYTNDNSTFNKLYRRQKSVLSAKLSPAAKSWPQQPILSLKQQWKYAKALKNSKKNYDTVLPNFKSQLSNFLVFFYLKLKHYGFQARTEHAPIHLFGAFSMHKIFLSTLSMQKKFFAHTQHASNFY